MRLGRTGLCCLGAVFALLASTGGASAQTFSGGSISASNGGTVSSTISVSGVSGTVATIKVELQGVTFDTTVDNGLAGATFVLKAPSSSPELILLGATGNANDGNFSSTPINITIQDGATPAPGSAQPSNQAWTPTPSSKTVEPSSYWGSQASTTPPVGVLADWPQTDGSATLNGKFAGTTADGTWTLTLVDSSGGNIAITGWQLTITANASQSGTTTTVSSSLNPSFTSSPNNSVTFTASVSSSGGTVSGGTVSFAANASAITCSGGNQTLTGAQATCVTTLTTQGINSITASYSGSGSFTGSTSAAFNQLVEVHPTISGTQYCNNATLSVPGGEGTPTQMAYPSVIGVPGSVTNSVANVTVQLNNMSTPGDGIFADSFLLVAPNGQNLDLLDGGFTESSGGTINLTFADSASGHVPSANTAPTSGTYLATDNRNTATSFPNSTPTAKSIDSNIPAIPGSINYASPFGGSGALNLEGAFGGAPGAGDWSLYIINASSGGDNISIGSWCLNFTLNSGAATTTSLTSTQNPAITGTSVTFTATVTSSGNPVTSGTVTFTDNGVAPAGTVSGNNVVALNGSGQATFATSSLAEGDHKIVATFSGVANTFNESTNFVWERENNAPTVTDLNTNPATFCNSAPNPSNAGNVNILLPAGSGGPENIGAANPNPSNIAVAGLPGTVQSLEIQLQGFHVISTDTINQIASLLVGPNGSSAPTTSQTLDFFSDTGGSPSSAVPNGNYFFVDSGASIVPQSSFAVGTYKPTSYASPTDTFFASPSGFYTLPASFQYAITTGTSTLNGVFGDGRDGNGTWSLYFNQNTHEDGNGATNGWCLQFTQNPPDLSVTSNNSPSSFRQGDTGDSITFTVTNNGPGSSGGTVTLAETVPTGFTVTGMSGSGWTCAAGQFPASSGTVSCTTSATIAATNTYPTLTATINVSSGAASSVANSATISGSMDDTTGNNTTTDTITVLAPAILTISKTANGAFTQGSTAEWDVTVGNNAAVAADTTVGTVTMSDTLPSGYTVNAFTGTNATTWSCTGTGTATANCTTSVQLNGGGATYPVIHIIVNVPANSAISVTNTADAFGGGDVNHTNIGNAITGPSTVTVVQVPASIVVNSGSGQSTLVSTAFTNPLVAKVTDAGGVAIAGASVTFAAPASGASASITSTNPATTNSSGLASVTVSANGTSGGPYTVTATVTSTTVTTSPGGFSLTNTMSPQVVSYRVDFGASSYNLVGASRTAHLPWTVSAITVVFTEPIASANASSLSGISATGFSGLGTNTMTWTFAGITNATLSTTLAGSGPNAIKDASGNALAGGAGFSQAFSVLYGDFTGDGSVLANDGAGVNTATKTAYNQFADLNGDGVVNLTDVSIARAQLGAVQH
jgi:hypothetical protein